jgi:hypothetical protein
VTAVMRTAAISPIVKRKYLKTPISSFGLHDAQAQAAWLTLSTQRGVPTRVVQMDTNVTDLNKPRCTKSYKRIGLRFNVHPHTLALDGVYVRDESSAQLVFHQLPEPTHQEVEQLASRIAERSEKVMRKHGRWVDDDSAEMKPEQLSLQYPALSQCYGASVRGVELLSERAGRPCMRLLSTPPMDKTEVDPGATAVVRGFNLHGKTRVDGCDRLALQKLCRYIARPPIAQDRLHILQDGRVRYDMKRTWKDGTKAIVLSPLDFIARLCALVPPPYFHLTRFHGLLRQTRGSEPR